MNNTTQLLDSACASCLKHCACLLCVTCNTHFTQCQCSSENRRTVLLILLFAVTGERDKKKRDGERDAVLPFILKA